jgi:hypothetical protein
LLEGVLHVSLSKTVGRLKTLSKRGKQKASLKAWRFAGEERERVRVLGLPVICCLDADVMFLLSSFIDVKRPYRLQAHSVGKVTSDYLPCLTMGAQNPF